MSRSKRALPLCRQLRKKSSSKKNNYLLLWIPTELHVNFYYNIYNTIFLIGKKRNVPSKVKQPAQSTSQ